MIHKPTIVGWTTREYMVAYYTFLTVKEAGWLREIVENKVGSHIHFFSFKSGPDLAVSSESFRVSLLEEGGELQLEPPKAARIPQAILYMSFKRSFWRRSETTEIKGWNVFLTEEEAHRAVDLLASLPHTIHAMAVPIDKPPMDENELRDVLREEWEIDVPFERDPREWRPR